MPKKPPETAESPSRSVAPLISRPIALGEVPRRAHRAFTEALRGAWRAVARPEQLAPTVAAWVIWLFLGGRGTGKTRSGAEWICERVAAGARFIHLIAPTAADCRDVMLEGPAGILSISPPHLRPVYQPSLRKVVWPNGAQALLFSSDEPDRLRGPQADTIWVDELCAMRQAQDVLDMALMGLRLGKDPKMLITTTPRPIKTLKGLIAREGQDVVVTRSSSYANRDNLAPSFFAQIVAKYAGTRLGRQELEAELLTDVPGALWHLERIEELRVKAAPQPFERVVVSIDPAVTFGPDSDETGIIVSGLGADGQGYVLDDLSGRYPPEEWARRAIQAYRVHSADRIVAEVNNGGALVESTLRAVDPSIPFRAVHASRGKLTRAEPVSALYEQGKVHHVGTFGPLEDQMTSYDGSRTGGSPDRLDALCWGIHELMLTEVQGGFIKADMLLQRHAADGARAPIEVPRMLDGILVSIAGGVGAQPDEVAAVFLGFCSTGGPPVVILDWGIVPIEADILERLLPAIETRVGQLAGQIRLTGASGHHLGALLIDPDGIGELLFEQHERMPFQHIELVKLLENEATLKMLPAQRAVAASTFVAAGHVQITRPAHDELTEHRGVTRNHLLHAIGSFGIQSEAPQQQEASALLIAFCNGVLELFRAPRIQARRPASGSNVCPVV